MKTPEKYSLLIISHESSLSGAPILLLHLLRVLKSDARFDVRLIVKRGGPLDKEFLQLGSCTILKPLDYQVGKSFFGKVLDYMNYRIKLLQVLRAGRSCDVILSNTITNGRLLKSLKSLGLPIAVYVHELQSVIDHYNRHKDSNLSFEFAECFLSPSTSVTENLVVNNEVGRREIAPLSYYIPYVSPDSWNRRKDFVAGFSSRRLLMVCGMGTATLRKGIDIFIQTCSLLQQAGVPAHFTWIGDFLDADLKNEMMTIVKSAGIANRFAITGFLPPNVENLMPYDLLLLASREDPYPLVVIEAAYLGIGTVYCPATTGSTDILKDGCGFEVDSLAPYSFAQVIQEIVAHPENLSEVGAKVQRRAKEIHADPSRIIDQLVSGINLAGELHHL